MTKIKQMAVIAGMLLGCTMTSVTAAEKSDVILTSEQGCQIHYITDKNVDGWSIGGQLGECPDGWIDGYADITISNAFGKPVEQIFGHFRNGFWVGSKAIPFSVVGLSETNDNERALNVELDQNEEHNIQYLGQLRAKKMADGSFDAFTACPTTRILAVTENRDIFENETVQSELLNEAIHYAKTLCPEINGIHFYGAPISEPSDKDIFFFAEIDLGLRQIQVKRLPSSAQKKAEAERLARIRVEPSGVPIMKVTPIRPQSMESSLETEKETEKIPEIAETKDTVSPPEESDIDAKEAPVSEATPSSSVQATETAPSLKSVSDSSPLTTESDSVSNDTITPNIEKENKIFLDAVPHLLTASRLLKKTVSGTAVVHVFRVDLSGQAWIDLPVPMKANGRLVQTGWNIVSGLFSAEPPTRTKNGGIPPLGTIVLTDAVPCSEDGCFIPTMGGTP